ncbi:MAG: TIGR03546 family protein [bacterium]
MFWLKFLSKFIKVLRAGESPRLIAGGFTMGFVIGLTPFWTLQNMVILAVAILTKVNLAAAFLSLFLFSFIAYLFDPLFHDIGYFILVNIEALKGIWTALYNWPIAPFTRFYNTIVMGSLATALILAYPIYTLTQRGIIVYRKSWAEKIEKSKFVKAVKGSSLFKWYVKIKDLEW